MYIYIYLCYIHCIYVCHRLECFDICEILSNIYLFCFREVLSLLIREWIRYSGSVSQLAPSFFFMSLITLMLGKCSVHCPKREIDWAKLPVKPDVHYGLLTSRIVAYWPTSKVVSSQFIVVFTFSTADYSFWLLIFISTVC